MHRRRCSLFKEDVAVFINGIALVSDTRRIGGSIVGILVYQLVRHGDHVNSADDPGEISSDELICWLLCMLPAILIILVCFSRVNASDCISNDVISGGTSLQGAPEREGRLIKRFWIMYLKRNEKQLGEREHAAAVLFTDLSGDVLLLSVGPTTVDGWTFYLVSATLLPPHVNCHCCNWKQSRQ